MKKLIIVMTALIPFARSVQAFDKTAFEIHLRKALNLDTRVEIKISSDPIASGVGNLNVVNITLGGAPYPVYMTPDEKQYLWGMLLDATVDPDAVRSGMIDLKNAHSQGISTAPVTVVEFSDLQCSHCKQAHETLKKDLYAVYKPEQVRLVFKHFPLSGHDWSEAAAVAAECAAAQKEKAFWEVSDFFFVNQATVTKENVRSKSIEAAKGAGLKKEVFEKCLDSTQMLEKVRADKKEGGNAGVSSTPTLFVNGRMRRGFRNFEDIKVVIEEKLAEVRK